MGVPVAAGHNNYSGTYIQELYSGKILMKFYDATVLSSITNTDYEGEITSSGGDKVHIRQTPDVPVRDYERGQNLTFDHLQTDMKELNIDKAKYYGFTSDTVDERLADIDYINDMTEDAAIQLQLSIDLDVLTNVPADADAANQGLTAGKKSAGYNLGVAGTALVLTATNILTTIIQAGGTLDEQNVPEEGRFMVLPSWACVLIKDSDLKSADFNDGMSPVRSGYIGTLDRFSIYRSNRLNDTAGEFDIIFGQKSAISFAAAITEHRFTDNPFGFGTLHKGLCVYGYETLKPTALGRIVAKVA